MARKRNAYNVKEGNHLEGVKRRCEINLRISNLKEVGSRDVSGLIWLMILATDGLL
jgi:hypothetical protein